MSQEPRGSEEKRHDEDTEAILARRRFLIRSALAGAGLGAVLAGCESKPEAVPRPCLSVAVPPPTSNTDAQPKTSTEPKPGTATKPEVCLKIAPPEKPPEPAPKTVTEPQICLSVPAPQPCLTPAPPKEEPGARPCLSIRRDR